MLAKAVFSLVCAGFVLGTAGVSHAAVQQNIKTPIVVKDFAECANDGVGEEYYISGIMHTLVSYTATAKKASGIYMTSGSDLKGYGLTTGTRYVGTGKIGSVLSVPLQNGTGSQTLQNTTHLIGQGSAPDLFVHENLRVVFQADGTVTVFIDNVRVTCH